MKRDQKGKWLSFISLRTKIAAGFILVVLLGGLISALIGNKMIGDNILKQAQIRVNHNQDAAWMVYDNYLHEIEMIIDFTTKREDISSLLEANKEEILCKILNDVKEHYQLDFLSLTDVKGRVIIRTSNPEKSGDYKSSSDIIPMALKGESKCATQILSRQELLKEGGLKLADQAFIKIIPTPKAIPTTKEAEASGMVLKAAAPIRNKKGNIIGVLYGGRLLNRNYSIVDNIKNLVYKGEKYNGKDIGTATIFQGDLRISTNVKMADGKRAIGTRVSNEVHQKVLQEGRPWIDRAFVVDDWYIASYSPIRDIFGNIIGILYVGILEQPYKDLKKDVISTFLILTLMGVILVTLLAYYIAGSITKPLQNIVSVTRLVANGDLSQEVKVNSRDEMGYLATMFNQMVGRLKDARKELEDWGKMLEQKVEKRTKELKAARDQILRSEKLAGIGRMVAGVCHEILNPLNIISGHSQSLLIEKSNDRELCQDLESIMEEIQRISKIISSLLKFSRKGNMEFKKSDIRNELDSVLSLVEKEMSYSQMWCMGT